MKKNAWNGQHCIFPTSRPLNSNVKEVKSQTFQSYLTYVSVSIKKNMLEHFCF